MAATFTTSISSISQGANGAVAVTDGQIAYTVNVSVDDKITFSAGAGAGAVNNIHWGDHTIAGSSSININLFTGAVTGSETLTLNTPAQQDFALTGLKYFEVTMGTDTTTSASISLAAGSASGFAGWNGNSTVPMTVVRSTNGGNFRMMKPDAAGWEVSASLANLVINNSDTTTAAITLYIAGKA